MPLFEHLHMLSSLMFPSYLPWLVGGMGVLVTLKMKNNLLFLLLPVLVAACGGDSSSDSSNEQNGTDTTPNTLVAINALDSTTSVRKGTTGIVDLEKMVKTSDGSNAYLSAVTPIGEQDAQCRNVNIDASNLTFTVRATDIGACTYQYQVSDVNNTVSTTAVSRVAVQSAAGPTAVTYTLPPIGQTVTESETINIDLVAELGSSFPNGGVVESAVTVLGSGAAVADSATNTISYTAANQSNVTRVLYTIIAGTEGEDVYLGTIDIAVSTTLNTVPAAQSFTYQDPICLANNSANNANERCDLISSGNNIVIDLVDKISDPDEGDTPQVIEVYSFDADVSLTNPADPESASITFNTTLPKVYYVSYVVSDHRGGYAIGQIEINIVGAFPYIIVNETSDVFAPPMTSSQAGYLGLNILGIQEESEPTGPNGTLIPTFDWETANAICVSKGGSLPTREQFTALIQQEGFNLYTNNGWPSSFPFWTRDLTEDQINAYAYEPISSIASGQVEFTTIATIQGAYVSCIDKTPSTINIVNPSVIPLNYPYQMNVNYQTASGVILPYNKPLIWETSDPSIATIEQTGVVTGLINEEKVDLTATTYDGTLSDSESVMVMDNMVVLAGASYDFEMYQPYNTGECVDNFYDTSAIGSNIGESGWTLSPAYGREEDDTANRYGLRFVTDCAVDSADGLSTYVTAKGSGSSDSVPLTTLGTFPFIKGADYDMEIDLRVVRVLMNETFTLKMQCSADGFINGGDTIFQYVEIVGASSTYFKGLPEPYLSHVEITSPTGKVENNVWMHIKFPFSGEIFSSLGDGTECAIILQSSTWVDFDNITLFPIAKLEAW